MDLYLLHQPYAEVTEAWRAMEEAKKAGKIRSIGISNMTPKFWDEFVPQFDSVPSVNQVEFNPYFQQKELRSILAEDNVKLGAWAPLGQGNIDLFNEPIIVNIAEKYSKNAGQVILRFEDQEGIIVFPKSTHKEKITYGGIRFPPGSNYRSGLFHSGLLCSLPSQSFCPKL